ncbi:monovalent cation/H+ antiporter subunit E [Corynebacterium qintianiae]|uniref:Monovalent cation/H+ antiporter subunit E n=1 Tax=Corynebacterium qintianiae TaxID=2709392 RepID=A0A7T0KMU7_9CORY|nr:monovalent cation/H+ antiporter subunit E [Corynebacterium qintianiae]QPK83384.1 monovalent cation/H+ antiporter subunit E [Corynebacterium qintianiae]
MSLHGIGHTLGYAAWLVKEIFAAGFAAVAAAFKPQAGIRPVIIYYPLRITTDWELFWFSTSITATPGTLSLGFRHNPDLPGQKVLIVQAVFGADPVGLVEGLMDMEERLKPSVADIQLDPASVEWQPYRDLGPDQPPRDLPPAERLD